MLFSFFLSCSAGHTQDCPSGNHRFEENATSYAYSDCTGLTVVTFSPTVLSIEEFAFLGCTGITKVYFEEGCLEIGPYSFQNCTSLTEMYFPASLTGLNPTFNEGCTSLKHFSMVKNSDYLSVDDQGFLYNGDKTTIYTTPYGWEGNAMIPATVQHNVRDAFHPRPFITGIFVEEGNPSYVSEQGILFTKDKTILRQAPMAIKLSTFIVPPETRRIFLGAFEGVTGIQMMMIGANLTHIDYETFLGAKIDKIVCCPALWENISMAMNNVHLEIHVSCMQQMSSHKKGSPSIIMTPWKIAVMTVTLLIAMIIIVVVTVYVLRLRDKKNHTYTEALL